jgi:aryl-alcohol dehydrogenase-like predicted oxidoreductase/spore coat polysaccharide biosynthesis protein SpsF (cytidylyltransferase family)
MTSNRRVVAILQARMGSTRLPGKALLPVAGYPCAVLAALRAGNLGGEIRLATSHDATDNVLAEVFAAHRIPVVRASLHDVLSRFCAATDDLNDQDVVVRLTGDNVVPDGEFVNLLADGLIRSSLEYLAPGSPQDRLPYGLVAEAFLVGALRHAQANATGAYDREHVGPWMLRNCRVGSYVAELDLGADYSHLRCTVDDHDDYARIVRLFERVEDAVRISWRDLVRSLAALPGEPDFRVPYKVIGGSLYGEMVLGTAQLGMDYGIANRTGKPSREQAIKMVRQAIAHGVSDLDTARAYGDSEHVIGQALAGAWRSRVRVITKLAIPSSVSTDADDSAVRAAVDRSIAMSCAALGCDTLDPVLLHRWQDHDACRGAAWRRLLELREERKIGTLGASVYTPTEACSALRDAAIKHIQIPLNILDWRWRAAGVDRLLADRTDVIVHARSAYLQGVLIQPPDLWPAAAGAGAAQYAGKLQALARRFDRESVADLCLSYVRSQPWITSTVVGCETLAQLQENLRLFRNPKLSSEQCEQIENEIPQASEDLLNPSRWNLTHEPALR